MTLLSDEQIAAAKATVRYSLPEDTLHEHNDCIRIAYEWLDAQTLTKGLIKTAYPIKHLVEGWGGRYVSRSDVEVAAAMHPNIRGIYPHFNISKKLTRPSGKRLAEISQARVQGYKIKPDSPYAQAEVE